jgi:hypothetical protein
VVVTAAVAIPPLLARAVRPAKPMRRTKLRSGAGNAEKSAHAGQKNHAPDIINHGHLLDSHG